MLVNCIQYKAPVLVSDPTKYVTNMVNLASISTTVCFTIFLFLHFNPRGQPQFEGAEQRGHHDLLLPYPWHLRESLPEAGY